MPPSTRSPHKPIVYYSLNGQVAAAHLPSFRPARSLRIGFCCVATPYHPVLMSNCCQLTACLTIGSESTWTTNLVERGVGDVTRCGNSAARGSCALLRGDLDQRTVLRLIPRHCMDLCFRGAGLLVRRCHVHPSLLGRLRGLSGVHGAMLRPCFPILYHQHKIISEKISAHLNV